MGFRFWSTRESKAPSRTGAHDVTKTERTFRPRMVDHKTFAAQQTTRCRARRRLAAQRDARVPKPKFVTSDPGTLRTSVSSGHEPNIWISSDPPHERIGQVGRPMWSCTWIPIGGRPPVANPQGWALFDSDALRQQKADREAWANTKPMRRRIRIPAFRPFLALATLASLRIWARRYESMA